MPELTMGELLSRRRLVTTVYNGQLAYEVGQHSAVILGDQAILSYVDNSHELCIVPCKKDGKEWITYGYIVRCGVGTVYARFLGRPQPLSDESVRALQEATKKPTQKKGAASTKKTTPSAGEES